MSAMKSFQEHAESAIVGTIIGLGVGIFFGFIVGTSNGRQSSQEFMEKQAVARGYGTYEVRNEGNVFEFATFEWKKNPALSAAKGQ